MGSPWAGGVLRNSPLISPPYVICYMAHGSFPQFLKKFQKNFWAVIKVSFCYLKKFQKKN